MADSSLRPSIETGFHAVLKEAVIHTHSTYVNIFACAKEGEKNLSLLFPDSCFIPYRTPGTPLTIEVSIAFKARPVDIFFLKNHGLIVSGTTVREAMEKHRYVNDLIKKHLRLPEPIPPYSIRTKPDGSFESSDEQLKSYLAKRIAVLRTFKETVLFPDQIVYCQKFGLGGEGKPITLDEDTGVITYNTSYKEAQAFIETLLAWLHIYDGIMQNKLSLSLLPKDESKRIANLDTEKYRQRLIS